MKNGIDPITMCVHVECIMKYNKVQRATQATNYIMLGGLGFDVHRRKLSYLPLLLVLDITLSDIVVTPSPRHTLMDRCTRYHYADVPHI
jgi:hypothetical protein